MRRAWLPTLALALAPAIAAGQVTFGDSFINADACTAGTVELSWTVSFVNGATSVPTGGEYHVYAANQAHTSPDCHTTNNNDTGLRAGELTGSPVDATGQSGGPTDFSANEIVARAEKSCSATSRETIYVCVQGTATANGQKFGFATGSFTLDTRKPPPPVISGTPEPGDGALWVSWSPGTATTTFPGDSHEYRMEAKAVGANAGADPQGTHVSPTTTDTSQVRFEGLVNDVVYEVRVSTFSEAGNLSDPSGVVTGEPKQVNDFWDAYRAAGGREQGGCAGGPAGIASLVAMIAAVALLWRRK